MALLPEYPGTSIEELCTSVIKVIEEPWWSTGFRGPLEYSMETFWEIDHLDRHGRPDGQLHKYNSKEGQAYDIDSIMHYHSITDAEEGVGDHIPATVMNVPLVKWKHGAPGYQPPSEPTADNAELIEPDWSKGPSDADFEGIKAIYSWEG